MPSRRILRRAKQNGKQAEVDKLYAQRIERNMDSSTKRSNKRKSLHAVDEDNEELHKKSHGELKIQGIRVERHFYQSLFFTNLLQNENSSHFQREH